MKTFFRLVVAQQEVAQPPARQRLGRGTGRIGRVESRRVRAESRTATACSALGREWRIGLRRSGRYARRSAEDCYKGAVKALSLLGQWERRTATVQPALN